MLKGILVEATNIQHYQPHLPVCINTDSSNVGLGAVVTQRNSLGNEGTLAYASRVSWPAELNYTTTEKECLAVVWACDHLNFFFNPL